MCVQIEDYSSMATTLVNFPCDRFSIHAYWECGHSAQIDLGRLPSSLTVDALQPWLTFGTYDRRSVSIRIGWTAAARFKHSAGAAL